MKCKGVSSVGKPTRGKKTDEIVRQRRGGQYRPRTGGDAPPKKRRKQKTGVTYVPPVQSPRWARKYASES